MDLRPYGPNAWLIEDVPDPAGWAAGLTAIAVEGVVDVVPAENTVLVRSAPTAADAVAEAIELVEPVALVGVSSEVVIDVRYDGPDIADVAAHAGLSPAEVVDRHRAAEYTVAFCGFSPGFAYLRGLPDDLVIPRRPRPRTVVPAGSVAVAARYSAIYPSASPGGWHLLGTTDAVVWDVDRDPPARLTPGTIVRFRSV